jgi:hypothetical protein
MSVIQRILYYSCRLSSTVEGTGTSSLGLLRLVSLSLVCGGASAAVNFYHDEPEQNFYQNIHYPV